MNPPEASGLERLDRDQAYDQARKEFYYFRLQEDVERYIGREEAENMGAHFGMSNLEIGMQLEDKEYDKWKQDAYQTMETQRLRQGAQAGESPTLAPTEEEALAESVEEPKEDLSSLEKEGAARVDDGDDG